MRHSDRVPFIHYHHFESTPSTNTWAMQNAASFDREGITIVTADEQSAGRGRLDRKWVSPAGVNLYMTFCLFLNEGEVNISNIPQILALAAAEVIQEIGVDARLKWPNDLVVKGKKIGGILCETKPLEEMRFIAIGIGLNINMSDEFLENATSLLIECGQLQHCDSIKILIEERFLSFLALFKDEGFKRFCEAFRQKLYMPEPFRFHHNHQIVKGRFDSLNADGSLTLLLDSGEKKSYCYGEIL